MKAGGNSRYQHATQACPEQSGHVKILFVELLNPRLHFVELICFFFCLMIPPQNIVKDPIEASNTRHSFFVLTRNN
jgi:hypothetical protein